MRKNDVVCEGIELSDEMCAQIAGGIEPDRLIYQPPRMADIPIIPDSLERGYKATPTNPEFFIPDYGTKALPSIP